MRVLDNIALHAVITAFADSVSKANQTLETGPSPVAIVQFQTQYKFSGALIQPIKGKGLILSKLQLMDMREKTLTGNVELENITINLTIKPIITSGTER